MSRPADQHEDQPGEPMGDRASGGNHDDVDSMETMASGIRKKPDPSPEEPAAPELPPTFTGDGPDDMTTVERDHGDPFEGLGDLPPSAPTEIAGFVIRGVIGQGGMGSVYLAMQRRPRRPVAIKVMRAGVASPMALRRFEFEAQMLARLTHPGIAQIYEAGTFDQGDGAAPFFAMEYVPNARLIDEYCDEHNLDTRARVELMAKVCDAVGAGHGKGIIHRDLKPGNILVSSAGHPKIIDFGVARSTDSDQRVTMQTDVHAIVGTLQYMAPEQCSGDVLDLDTSADVYALGVALYEVLAGQLPYEVSGGITTAIKTVTESKPPPISTIKKSLGGDLEVVVSKAMEKDRSDRYRTASELGDDLRRWLRDEPITARPPTLMTSFKRLVRRNKGLAVGVIAMAIVLALAVTSGVLALVNRNLALETQNELLEEQSEKRAMVGDLITFFMRDSFDAIATLANSQKARESLVDVSLEYLNRLRAEAGNDPSLNRMLAEGLQQAGINEWSLQSGNRGQVGGALEKWEESLAIADGLHAADLTDVESLKLAIRARSLLQTAYRRVGRTADRLRVVEEAEALIDLLPAPLEDPDQGRLVMGVLLDRSRLIPEGDDPEQTPEIAKMLSFVGQLQGAFPDEEAIQRDATLAWARVAYAWNQRREHDKSLHWYQRTRDVRQQMLEKLGPSNTRRRDVMNAHRYVAQQLWLLTRLDDALDAYKDVIRSARTLVMDNPSDARSREDLVRCLVECGHLLIIMDHPSDALALLGEARVGWMERVGALEAAQEVKAIRDAVRGELLLAEASLQAELPQEARAAVEQADRLINRGLELQAADPVLTSQAQKASDLRDRVLKDLGRLKAD